MRIVCNPILISPDGESVLKSKDVSYAFLMIDPKKWSAAGVQEAIEYAKPAAVAEALLLYAPKDRPMSEADVSNISVLPTAQFMNALSDKSAQVYHNRIMPLVSKSYVEVVEEVTHYLNENIQKAKSAGVGLLARFPKPSEHPSQQLVAAKMKTAIESLPDYLRIPLMHENVTIASVSNTDIENAGAGRAGIFFNMDFLLALSPQELNPIMKEEVIHYFAKKLGHDRREDYLQAADALFDKGKKEGADSLPVIKILQKIHKEEGKQSNLASFINEQKLGCQRDFSTELFAEYFHIRDHLLQTATKMKGQLAALQTDEDAVARTNNLMRSIVCDAIHAICQEFEMAMQQKADQLRSQQGRPGK